MNKLNKIKIINNKNIFALNKLINDIILDKNLCDNCRQIECICITFKKNPNRTQKMLNIKVTTFGSITPRVRLVHLLVFYIQQN